MLHEHKYTRNNKLALLLLSVFRQAVTHGTQDSREDWLLFAVVAAVF